MIHPNNSEAGKEVATTPPSSDLLTHAPLQVAPLEVASSEEDSIDGDSMDGDYMVQDNDDLEDPLGPDAPVNPIIREMTTRTMTADDIKLVEPLLMRFCESKLQNYLDEVDDLRAEYEILQLRVEAHDREIGTNASANSETRPQTEDEKELIKVIQALQEAEKNLCSRKMYFESAKRSTGKVLWSLEHRVVESEDYA